MISQETEEEIESQILSPRIPSKMEKKEREPQNPFVVLLKLTGLYFGNRNKENYWYYKENFWYYMGMLRALIMCALASYQAAVIVYKLFTLKSTNEKIPNTIFIASWHIQAALSMIFVVYWQLQGHLSQLFNVVNWPKANQNLSTHRSIRFTLIILITFMLFILIYITLNAYVLTTGKHKYFLTDLEFLEIFGTEQYRYFSVFVTYLASNIWLIVLVFYVIISIIAHGEFVRFNHDLEKIGEIDEEEESIRDQLLEEYSDHINKAKMVRIIDHTFEVYTFLMIGLNIPTTIFGIISCFTAPTTEQLLLALPAPIFCILQLVGLTAVPARVHTAV
uniref:Gustatory receptor n=1 Tax=Acrobeloides nanus TaxID=290746 RepID=A0A914E6N1_9BILA